MTKTSRGAIIAAAAELFREHGFAGASMKDLAERVGLRKGSLYNHFPSKEALVPAVLEHILTEIFQPAAGRADARAAYAEAVGQLARHLATHRRCVGLHLAYGIGDEASEARAAVLNFFAACRNRLAEILIAAFDPETAARIAVDTLTLLEGATLWLALEGDPIPLNRAADRLIAEVAAQPTEPPGEAAKVILDRTVGDWARATPAERDLAERLAEAEDRASMLEAALRGHIEAESCFR